MQPGRRASSSVHQQVVAGGPPAKRARARPAEVPLHAPSPQKPPHIGTGGPNITHTQVEPAGISGQPHASPQRPPQAKPVSAIPGVVAPGPVPPKGPLPMPNGLGNASWPVLPYLENVEYAIAHADSQPLTFHRTVTRPLSDFLNAVMHSLGVQVRSPPLVRPLSPPHHLPLLSLRTAFTGTPGHTMQSLCMVCMQSVCMVCMQSVCTLHCCPGSSCAASCHARTPCEAAPHPSRSPVRGHRPCDGMHGSHASRAGRACRTRATPAWARI